MNRWFWGMGLAAALLMVPVMPVQAAESAVTQVNGIDRVKSVAAAGDTYAALRADGTVWTWGAPTDKPQQVSVSCPVRSVALGTTLIAMVCGDGSVFTASIAIDEPGVHKTAQVQGLDSVKAVSMGATALVALRTDGSVWVADVSNGAGGVPRAAKVEGLSGLPGVLAVAAGINDFVAILSDGTARTAALAINSKGTSVKRLADMPSVRSVSVCGPGGDCDDSDPYTFVTADGKLTARAVSGDTITTVAVGDLDGDGYGDIVAGHGRTLTVTAAGDISVAVTGDGGGATTIKKPGPAFKQAAAGSSYDMGLTTDGKVWMWAAPTMMTQVPGLTGVKGIVSAGQWNLALAGDGTITSWSWGASNSSLRTYVIPHVLEVRQMAATPDAYFLLQTDGSIAAGKWPASGSPPAEPVIHRDLAARAMAAGDGHVAILKFDGTEEVARIAIDEQGVHFGDFTPVAGVSGAVQVAAGQDGYLTLRDDGTVWGGRWDAPPVQVKDVSGARAVSAGDSSLAVLLGDGSVRTIAIDESGVHVWGDPHVQEADGIAAGGSGGIIVICDGSVRVVTAREAGSGIATGRRQYVAVAAGTGHNLALAADGTVWTMIQLPASSK